MQHHSTVIAALLQQTEVLVVVQQPCPSGEVSGLTVAIQVFRVRKCDIVPKQFKRFVKDFAHFREFAFVEDVRAIHTHFQIRRLHFIKQATRFLR